MLFLCVVGEYLQGFLARAKPLLEKKEELGEEEMEKFGKKDAEAYPFVLVWCGHKATHGGGGGGNSWQLKGGRKATHGGRKTSP